MARSLYKIGFVALVCSLAAGAEIEKSVEQQLAGLPPIPLARAIQRQPEPDYSGPPTPYQFAYDSTDEFGTRLHREESGDAAGTKRGSYGYSDANGLYRTVTYIADASGFRATVKTNEPGTISGPVGDAIFESNAIAPIATNPRTSTPAFPTTRPKLAGALNLDYVKLQ